MFPCMQRYGSFFYSTAKGPAQPQVAIRLARHGDYSAIVRISEGLSGTDYVPAKFHSFIDDPDVTVFVAEVEHQVVGFRASKFTEGGQVYVGKAARVAPDWREQGIMNELLFHQEAWIRQNRPTVKYMRVTALSNSPAAEYFQTRIRHIFSLPFVSYQCGPGLWWRQDPAQLAQLEPTGLPDVVPLQDADDDFCTAVQKWLPAGACGGYDGEPVILVDWDPYNLCPANLKRVQKESTLFTLKHEGESSLSIVTTYLAPCGRMLCIDVYAKDFPTLQKHLFKHLYDASLMYTSDQVCMRVFSGVVELENSIHDFCRDVLNMDELHKPGLQAVLFESEL
ncbi:PREDICTED: histidine N-acetyltransferase-like [Branchiostoma belcheri]|uniref:Histidine N-acetyltransferase-like n=1 Tax=Branchiostoma belcheri TaxID=7741 RepID=A0A6P4ZB51_BRABE|nr:PREDICTED: histidine N-acetyltransferase-like [Branchiostoma belcheri]